MDLPANYKVVAKIGAGGMGEVYQAHDTKLDRDVAIKILPDALARHPDRIARFEREAKVLASLNHPNIAAIYGIEDRAIVMELVEGPTLKDRIAAGAIPLEESLAIARQIAEALEAAHQKSITHRDLKPANVKVKADGVVKVLDFGLAKVGVPAAASEDSPTVTIGQTEAGVILGTAAYMSPEQARGGAVDQRSDIYSFGAVLYEMLTGERLHRGESTTDVLASVVKDEPHWDKVPASVRKLLRKCLEKDPQKRLRHVGDVMALVDEDAPPAAVQPPAAKRPWLWAGIAAMLLVLGASAFFVFRPKPAAKELLRFQVLPPDNGSFGDYMALSPDGRKLAFTASGADGRNGLWVRNIDALDSRFLDGTRGAGSPFWSPDGRFLAFSTGSALKKIDVSGGPPVTLAEELDGNIGTGTWNAEGVILFGYRGATGPGVRRVSADGGAASLITKLDPARKEGIHGFPSFLPDGRHFLYGRFASAAPENTGVFAGSLDATPEQQSLKPLLAVDSNALYVPSSGVGPGQLLYVRGGTLMAQGFDPERLEVSGDAVPLAEHLGSIGNRYFYFTASANGVLAYGSGGGGELLTWFDRQGRLLGNIGDRGIMGWPAISPDGSTIVVDRVSPQGPGVDLWLHDVARGTAQRFTFGAGTSGSPVWSPDGSHLAFAGNRSGNQDVYQKPTNGIGQEELLDPDPRPNIPQDWSRDGRYILEGKLDPRTRWDVWVIPMFGDRKPFPYLQTEFDELNPRLSPNGQWLAYTSDETKRTEVYVQTFPAPGGKWQVSTSGGALPVWSRDGKELYFIGADRKMMAVDVRAGAGNKFEAGVPKPLFDTHMGSGLSPTARWFDVSKDGRFLIPTQAASLPITVVVNWQAGLKR